MSGVVSPRDKIPERFWSKVDKGPEPDACWVWTASQHGGDPGGRYGAFSIDGRKLYAHRVAFELIVGPIPKGLQIDHRCRNRLCVNPSHLEPVTARENTLRGDTPAARNLAKTHCIHGHPLSGDNLYVKPNGGRRCRACGRASLLRCRARQRLNRLLHPKKGAAGSVAPGATIHGGKP